MNSLRARLVLGCALVAVVPLALTMFLLARRIESTVHHDAAERLAASLGALRSQLAAERARIGAQLGVLGGDPTLKRLYLVQPIARRDLSDELSTRRVLLGLDVLTLSDTSGAVVAEVESGAGAAGDSAASVVAEAPIRYEGRDVGTLRGGRRIDAAFLDDLERTSGVALSLVSRDGRIVAASRGVAVTDAGAHLSDGFTLDGAAPGPARLDGRISTAAAETTIASLRLTSLVLGALGLVVAVLLGALWSRQVSRPVERLAAFADRVARGEWDEPLALGSVRELETLVEALERMRGDLTEYRARLVTSERQAAWSLMARKVAHEVKNPLTPIAISVADLKRSFEQKRADFPEILDQATRTVAAEVETLKHLLQEFSDFGRMPEPRPASVCLGDLLADLETLYGAEIAAGRLAIGTDAPDTRFTADAGQIRQALINLVKNALEAVEHGGSVRVTAAACDGALEFAVADTGPGLSEEARQQLFAPGFSTKRDGGGLGLTIVERIVNDHGGRIAVDSRLGGGTTVRVSLPLSGRS
jgi:signal transduction histidine kinase